MKNLVFQILSLAAFIAVLVVNYLAANGLINSTDTGAISDRFGTQITPSGWAFAIWSLIYLGLAGFTIYQALPSRRNDELLTGVRPLFVFNCIANAGWLFAWHYEMLWLSVLLMLAILVSLLMISAKVASAVTIMETFLLRFPFNLYFGWITVATILNITILLVSIGYSSESALGSYLGALLILVAGAIAVFVRFAINAFAYPMAIAWGVTAIAVKQSGDTPIVVAAAVVTIVCLFVSLWGAVKDKP